MPETLLGTYMREVERFSLLTAPQERDLTRRAAGGDRPARSALIEANLRLVVSVAHNYKRCGLDIADLIQEGNVGLIKAARAFKPERGVRFSTYAHRCIIDAITLAIAQKVHPIRIPIGTLDQIYRRDGAPPKRSTRTIDAARRVLAMTRHPTMVPDDIPDRYDPLEAVELAEEYAPLLAQ